LIDELEEHINEIECILKSEENEENIFNNNKLVQSFKEVCILIFMYYGILCVSIILYKTFTNMQTILRSEVK